MEYIGNDRNFLELIFTNVEDERLIEAHEKAVATVVQSLEKGIINSEQVEIERPMRHKIIIHDPLGEFDLTKSYLEVIFSDKIIKD